MQTLYYEFDRLEFQDCAGQFRSICQCSLANREEFRDYYNQLIHRFHQFFPDPMDGLDDNELFKRVEAIWDRPDERFRFLCRKCLYLAGVKADWVNLAMMVEMLFRQCKTFLYQGIDEENEPKEEIKPGLLIQLNFPKSKAEEKAKSAEYEEILAAIWAWTQDLDKALKLAKEHPAGELIKMIEERAKIAKNSTSEGRQKEQQKEWQRKAREDLEKIQQGKG